MSLVELGRYSSRMEAEIIRCRLESAGIFAACFDAGMNIAEGAALAIPVRVMVLDDEVEDACALLGKH